MDEISVLAHHSFLSQVFLEGCTSAAEMDSMSEYNVSKIALNFP
jgi:hypothetical protein